MTLPETRPVRVAVLSRRAPAGRSRRRRPCWPFPPGGHRARRCAMYPNPPSTSLPRREGRGLPLRTRGVLRLRHRAGRAVHDPHHRAPADGPAAFSGVVVAEALHAGGRSLVFESSRVSILSRGTCSWRSSRSPANVALLKPFNAEPLRRAQHHDGQTNEIIAQAGVLLKSSGRAVRRLSRRRLTLMGTSASSGTVRAYLPDTPALRTRDRLPDHRRLPADQHDGNTPLPIVDVPMIQMPTQTEVVTWAEMGIAYRRPDSDEAGNRFRLYEVAGMPHNNSRGQPGVRRDPCTLPVTGSSRRCFTRRWLDHRLSGSRGAGVRRARADRQWTEPRQRRIARWHGRAPGTPAGGIRNVWVDVPICRLRRIRTGKTTAAIGCCLLAGTEVPLPEPVDNIVLDRARVCRRAVDPPAEDHGVALSCPDMKTVHRDTPMGHPREPPLSDSGGPRSHRAVLRRGDARGHGQEQPEDGGHRGAGTPLPSTWLLPAYHGLRWRRMSSSRSPRHPRCPRGGVRRGQQ